MAKKKNVEKTPRQYTKRQISSIKRQKRRQNFIFYGGISIIVVVVIIVLVGLYIGEIRPYGQTALKIYDRDFSARYYMDATKYIYNPEYLDLQTAFSYASTYIQQAELIRRGAEELGIVVEDDEVKQILKEAGIEGNTKAGKLSEDELSRITQIIDRNYTVEGQLRRQYSQNIARLRDINCYRGVRHRRGLPVRGQCTQSNARTRKGPRKTVAGKKGVKEKH